MTQPGASLSNLLLLVESPPGPIIGQVGLTGSPLHAALCRIAGRVEDLDDPDRPDAVGSLDLGIVYGARDARIERAVRPGGWWVVLQDRVDRASLRAPSFKSPSCEVRHWLVSPDLSNPHSLVPYTHPALRAHQYATREPGWKRTVRLAAIRAGWLPREFRGQVIAVRKP